MRKINIVIADDHRVMLDGLKALLEKEENMNIVGEAINGNQVLRILETNLVDVAVLDIKMPEMDGIEVAKHIKALYPHTKILILTMYNDKPLIMELMEIGVHGYILKNKGQSDLITAILKVNDGKTYYPHDIMQIVIDERRKPQEEEVIFTKREKAVLKLIAVGKTTAEIAKELFLAETTINAYRRNLLSKIKGRNAADLTRFAIKTGIVKL